MQKKCVSVDYSGDIRSKSGEREDGVHGALTFQLLQPNAFRLDFDTPKWSETDFDKMTILGH